MSDNDNNNDSNNTGGGRGNHGGGRNGGRGTYRGRRNNNNSGRGFPRRNYNNNSDQSQNNNSNNKKDNSEGATEALGNHVFDCTKPQHIEKCDETLKAIAMCVGTEFGKGAEYVKYASEEEEEADLDEPTEPQGGMTKMEEFKYHKKVKRFLDREE